MVSLTLFVFSFICNLASIFSSHFNLSSVLCNSVHVFLSQSDRVTAAGINLMLFVLLCRLASILISGICWCPGS